MMICDVCGYKVPATKVFRREVVVRDAAGVIRDTGRLHLCGACMTVYAVFDVTLADMIRKRAQEIGDALTQN